MNTLIHYLLKLSIPFVYVFLFLPVSLLAFMRPPEPSATEYLQNGRPYLVAIEPLVQTSEEALVTKGQLLPRQKLYTDLERLHLWTTPIDLMPSEEPFIANPTQPYPLYSTYVKDNFIDSPLTPLLSPLRKGIHEPCGLGETDNLQKAA